MQWKVCIFSSATTKRPTSTSLKVRTSKLTIRFLPSDCDSRPLLSLFTSDYYSPPDPKRSRASAYSVVLIVFLILKALVFAIFTGVMFGVQAVAISKDETGIESKKKEKESLNKPATRFAMNRSIKRFRCILSGFQLNWLNPFTKPPKHSSFKSPNDFV